ncbi:MAG: HlyD family secretion protein [Gammaproteobacteria bacterium HGW-Gammaproteobacteria-1]|jgi:RND family efflux transporter MFP subunit|nr:MAG: HlyD family secretion protein [Gammaproteobacteria bacterium HGW-Gammaproteobacteria-1]
MIRPLLPLLVLLPALAFGHGGEDHSHEAAPAPATPLLPRFEAVSPDLELLGVLQGHTLTLYLDRWASNEPLPGAVIEIEGGERLLTAAAAGEPGTYRAEADWLDTPGSHNLTVTVRTGSLDDLLIGTLEVPAGEGMSADAPRDVRLWWMAGGGALLIIAAAALFIGRRRHGIPALLLLVFVAGPGADLYAHEGEVHDEAPPPPAAAGSAPSRLADGSLFVPKPSQRLLNLRTVLTATAPLVQSVELAGHVIPDPNASGTLQAGRAGRIVAGPKGLPHLGQAVRRGDTLASLEAVAETLDRSGQEAQLAELEGQLAIARARLERLRQLEGSVPQKEIDAAAVEVTSIERRHDALHAGLHRAERLTAPAGGVISASFVRVGQVVAAGETLFEIVDPQRLWVEAVAYQAELPAQIRGASVRLPDGSGVAARYLGAGTRLQQQAIPLQFALQAPLPPLAVDAKVVVYAQTGAGFDGLALPRSAVVKSDSGEEIVWIKAAAERYVPRPVTTQPLDGARVAVTRGLQPGERVVVQGAALLAQIR